MWVGLSLTISVVPAGSINFGIKTIFLFFFFVSMISFFFFFGSEWGSRHTCEIYTTCNILIQTHENSWNGRRHSFGVARLHSSNRWWSGHWAQRLDSTHMPTDSVIFFIHVGRLNDNNKYIYYFIKPTFILWQKKKKKENTTK